METIIYHRATCSKSRETLKLLKEKQTPLRIINYIEEPPSQAELKRILKMLGKQPQEIFRFKEKIAQELKLSPKDKRTAKEWLDLLVKHPILMERPIVVRGGKAVLGRPPENVLGLL